MSAGANKAFLANPLAFLNANVIVPHGSLQAQANGRPKVINVNLIPDTTGNTCIGMNGQNVPMYRATGVDSKFFTTSNAFKAYYLPYRPNDTLGMNLGKQADYFFTDKIDGCTFATGIGGGMSPLVVHMNQQTNDGKIDQRRMDRQTKMIYGKGNYRQLSLPDYISPEEQQFKMDDNAEMAKTNVTVIGIRGGQGWNFYYQRRNWLGGTRYRLIDTGAGYSQI